MRCINRLGMREVELDGEGAVVYRGWRIFGGDEVFM